MNRETPMHSVTLTGAGLAPRLIKRAPAENQFRFYQLGLWPDLFGGCDLMREYGRIGQAGHIKVTHYATHTEAKAALEKLYQAKCRRGYESA